MNAQNNGDGGDVIDVDESPRDIPASREGKPSPLDSYTLAAAAFAVAVAALAVALYAANRSLPVPEIPS